MTKTALETVQAFQQSLGNGTDEWQNLFADDVTFKGPVDTVKGKEANIELNKSFFPLVKGYEPKTHFGHGNFACLEGTFTISTPKGNSIIIEMVEVYEVINGKIQNMNVYYDAEEFRKEFSQSPC